MSLVWKFKLLIAAPGLALIHLAFPSPFQVPRGWGGPCGVRACSRGPSLPPGPWQGWWAVPGSPSSVPPGQMPSVSNDKSMVFRVQLPAAVCACTHGGHTITPCVLKGTPGLCQQSPTPLDRPTTEFPGLDSLLPVAVGWGLAGSQTQAGATALGIAWSNLQTAVPWLCFALLWADSQVVFCGRRKWERWEEMILSAKNLFGKSPKNFWCS